MCTLAYWHEPLFSSGDEGNNPRLKPIWQALYEAGADLVLNGHDHNYERFLPQTPEGTLDLERGITQIVVGTGGAPFTVLKDPLPNSVVRNNQTLGVLKVRLRPTGYDWRFVPEPGKTFQDSGSAECHNASPGGR
jgi:hypothetical protein